MQMAPFEAQGGDCILGKAKQVGHVLALCRGGLVLRNRLDLEQRDFRVFEMPFFRRRLSNFFHHVGKRTSQLEPLRPTLQLLAKRLPIGFTEGECLAALTGVGATLVA
jgi:hypothetical protein